VVGAIERRPILSFLFAMLLAPTFQLLFGLLWTTHSAAAQSDEFVVDTGYAKYLGNQTRENTVAYLGVPYAEPPLGDLRFRAPLELNTTRVSQEAGGEPVDSRDYPEFCIQGSIGRTPCFPHIMKKARLTLLRNRG
jgi:hypothetical protein